MPHSNDEKDGTVMAGSAAIQPVMRKIRLRFLWLLAVVIACVVASTLYVRSVGTVYEYPLEDYAGFEVTANDISFEPAGMARAVEVHTGDDGVPTATIEGLEPGSGMMMVMLESAGGASLLRVSDGNVVVADGADFTGWEALPVSVALFYFVAALLCITAVWDLRERRWYSYQMAAFAGLALFSLIEAGMFAWQLVSGTVTSFTDFALAVVNAANFFVEVTVVPVAIAALLVCISNVELVRHEGARLVNVLGIAASLALAMAYLGVQVAGKSALGAVDTETMLALYVVNTLCAVGASFGIALLLGVCTCAWGAARHTPQAPRDFLIILGCGLKSDGTPTPLLAGRVDAALSFARSQQEAGFSTPTFVPSGGKGPDEVCSEAESMRGYLESKGVDTACIALEDNSTNTRENLAFSARVIASAVSDAGVAADAGTGADADASAGASATAHASAKAEDARHNPRVAFATTNYHVFRGYIYAHDAGLDAEGIASKTKLYFWPNAFLREFVGLIAARWPSLLLSYAVIAALYLVAEYALYLSMG